jgi:hypothetical protein
VPHAPLPPALLGQGQRQEEPEARDDDRQEGDADDYHGRASLELALRSLGTAASYP